MPNHELHLSLRSPLTAPDTIKVVSQILSAVPSWGDVTLYAEDPPTVLAAELRRWCLARARDSVEDAEMAYRAVMAWLDEWSGRVPDPVATLTLWASGEGA